MDGNKMTNPKSKTTSLNLLRRIAATTRDSAERSRIMAQVYAREAFDLTPQRAPLPETILRRERNAKK